MIEFKVNEQVYLETQDISDAATKTLESFESVTVQDINSLKTVEKYLEQQKSISNLVKAYVALVEKDIADVSKIISEGIDLDRIQAENFALK